jgi:hypothetical protein
MLPQHVPILLRRRRRDIMTLTATTSGAAETVTLQRITHSVNTAIDWGDGTREQIAANYTGTLTHSYAAAGSYPITIHRANSITVVDLRVSQISGLNTSQLANAVLTYFRVHELGAAATNVVRSEHMSSWTPSSWWLSSMPTGSYDIQSTHMSSWTPSYWRLYLMPTGSYDIQSTHMSSWTPSYWRLYEMPAGSYDIQSTHMSSWTPSTWWLYLMPTGSYDIQSTHMSSWTPSFWWLSSMPAGSYDIQSTHMSSWRPSTWRLYSMPAGSYDIQSTHMSSWRPSYWQLSAMPTGSYDIQSTHMSSWTPSYWRLSSMPTGSYDIQSTHMSSWTPSYWRLSSMPTGSLTITAASDFAGFIGCTSFLANDNDLVAGDVNTILYGLYQAAASRTATGGTIDVGGTNQAPSGTFQAAAACPVDALTPGKEVQHELLNDGCGGINLGRVWATVTVTA